MNPTIPSSPADRLALILERLHQALGRHADAQRLVRRGHIIGPRLVQIWNRVRRIGQRFTARATREAADLCRNPPHPKTTPEAAPKTKTVIASEAKQSRNPPQPGPSNLQPPQPEPLPRRKAWLLNMIPETAPISGQLRYFMAEPEVAAYLAASSRLRSILNPLCHMLGIPQAKPPKPKQPPSPPPAPPPDTPAIALPKDATQQAATTILPPTTPPPDDPESGPPTSGPPPSKFLDDLA